MRAPPAVYPVLYLTDAEAQFEHTSATAAFLARNGFMPEVIVVGVKNTDRTRDLSPSHDPKFPTSGGADRFLDFFEKELVPFVESGYRTAPFRIFAGHSAGGLFALHSMRAKPGLFQAVIAVSPWLVWDGGKELELMKPFLSGDGVKTRALFFTLGDEGAALKEGLAQLSSALGKSKSKGLRWGSATYPNENHGSVVLGSHYAALRMIFDGWALPVDPETERIEGSLDEIKKRYADLSERLGWTVQPPEVTVNRLGYQALARNIPLAISFFRYNASTYPESRERPRQPRRGAREERRARGCAPQLPEGRRPRREERRPERRHLQGERRPRQGQARGKSPGKNGPPLSA